MGTFASKGENLGAKELNIPKWVWYRGWRYSNFAVDNSAVGIARLPNCNEKIDRYDKRRKKVYKGVSDNDCR